MGTLADNTEGAIRGRLSPVEALRSYSRSENNGVTHVYFYIGPSWFAHGLGLITLGVANVGFEIAFAVAGHNNKYFDSDTGEYLGNGQDVAAQTLHNKGENFMKEKQFDKASTCFKKAYNSCSRGYSEEQDFKRKWDAAEQAKKDQEEQRRKEAEAQKEEQRRQAEAAQKAEEARKVEERRKAEETLKAEEARKAEEHRKAEEIKKAEERRKAEEEKKAEELRKAEEAKKVELETKARINAEAENHYKRGMEFWKSGKFKEAKDSFEDALLRCTDDYGGKGTFEKGIGLAEVKLKEFARLKKEKRDQEDASKFEQARQMEEQQNSGVNQRAELENQKGLKFWTEGNFTEAQKCFETALLLSTGDYGGKTRFEKNVQVAKWKIKELTMSEVEQREYQAERKAKAIKEAEELFHQTMNLWKSGWNSDSTGDPEEASRKFKDAQRKLQFICKYFSYVGEYERYREMVNFKISGDECYNKAIDSEEEGTEHLEAGRIKEAAQKFEKGFGQLLEAKMYFSKGFQKGGREFGDCVDLAMESIDQLQNALGQLESLQIDNVLKDLEYISKDNKGKWDDDGVQQEMATQYHFQLSN